MSIRFVKDESELVINFDSTSDRITALKEEIARWISGRESWKKRRESWQKRTGAWEERGHLLVVSCDSLEKRSGSLENAEHTAECARLLKEFEVWNSEGQLLKDEREELEKELQEGEWSLWYLNDPRHWLVDQEVHRIVEEDRKAGKTTSSDQAQPKAILSLIREGCLIPESKG
jgi:chromosome segregation ATPase